MIVINDLHLGVIRTAGTTPASALALRKFALNKLAAILSSTKEDVVILGDLFDTFSVPMQDLLDTYHILRNWLEIGGRKLHLVAGNHDLSKDSTKLSSFQFLAKLLESPNCTYLQGVGWLDESKGIYAISHVLNQDLMDMHLATVPKCKYLLVHANYDNHFAVQSDHSLNISKEQAEELPCEKIVFAHEHHSRTALSGKVFVCGNQFPTSVSDCLDKDDKFAHRLTDSGIEKVHTWIKSDFIDMPWNAIVDTTANFIRISGTAKPEEASAATEAVANLRRVSQALVITNAVQVGTDEELQQASLKSLEAVQAFDVMAALKEVLTKEEYAVIEKL